MKGIDMFKLNKKKLPGFLLIVLAIYLPFILVGNIIPEWLGRMVAIGYYNLVVVLIFLLMIVSRNYLKYAKINPRIEHKIKNREKYINHWGIVVKIFGLCLIVFFTYNSFLPYIKDVSSLFKGNKLNESSGVLTEVGKGTIPFSEYFFQSLRFDEEGGESKYFQYLFPTSLDKESRYRFIYTSNSRLILELDKIETNEVEK